MIDKEYCMSSYLTCRFIEDDSKDFFEGLKHNNAMPDYAKNYKYVYSADDIDSVFEDFFATIPIKKSGLLLSGGMDSAILASYMSGANAYTFRFLGGTIQQEELKRAEWYAKYYDLNLKYVDIDWSTVEEYLDSLMKHKAAPVHSIEPQIMKAAKYAQDDGIELMITGASSDLLFGGMDRLLSKDWKYDDFIARYTFLNPQEVLCCPVEMEYLFEKYRCGEYINFQDFMQEVMLPECECAYKNAFETAGIAYYDPYLLVRMGNPLDLDRIRSGESKYLIRELFKKKYPNIVVPEKLPMPRPVDEYFKNWKGPERPEFKKSLLMSYYTGNQKWQLYCLERFLNTYDV